MNFSNSHRNGNVNNLTKRELNRLRKLENKTKLSQEEKYQLERFQQRQSNQEVERYENVNRYHKYMRNPTKYRTDWVELKGGHADYYTALQENHTVVVQAPSGVGKTTIAIYDALQKLSKNQYDRILFLKTPNEAGDDKIGFLEGGKDSKLESHFKNMRGIFHEFMSPEQLTCDEKNGNIKFDIPNFLQGGTFRRTYVIIDETQNMSNNTVKLLLERFTDDCMVVVLGDNLQTYSVDKRNDGFTDLVNRFTDVLAGEEGESTIRESKLEGWAYIELTSDLNKRGERSRQVTKMYGSK